MATTLTRQRVREIGLVVHVPFVGVETQLIGSRIGDRADQPPQIVIVIDEILGERIQKLWIHGRITGANIVHRLNEPAFTLENRIYRWRQLVEHFCLYDVTCCP